MKTCLNELLEFNCISAYQHKSCINYFTNNWYNVNKNNICNDPIKITFSKDRGYYNVYYSFANEVKRTPEDTFKFTKEWYLRI